MTSSCRLVSGYFAVCVQLLLAFLCVSTLIIKREREVPKRDWYVWFLDASKQGLSSSLGHSSNILLSIVIANTFKDSDECQWYCVAYIIDCIFGTCLNFILLMLFDRLILIISPVYAEFMKFGQYGNPPTIKRWFPQVLVWLLIVMMSKAVVLSFLIVFMIPINKFGEYAFRVITPYPKFELLLVMIGIPMVMNSVQFWLTDTVLKQKHTAEENYSIESYEVSSQFPLDDSDFNEIDEVLLQVRTIRYSFLTAVYSLSEYVVVDSP